jgi:hypothetical protein
LPVAVVYVPGAQPTHALAPVDGAYVLRGQPAHEVAPAAVE